MHEKSTKPKNALVNLPTGVTDVAAFKKLMEIPKNFVMSAIADATMGKTNGYPTAPLFINATNNIRIWCRDGNATEFPRCWYSANPLATVPSTNAELNVSKASF